MAHKIRFVGCVIVDDYDRLLLLHKQADDMSYWELPGGRIGRDELPESAAVRTLQQELGISARLVKMLGAVELEDDEHDYTYHWFQAQVLGGNPVVMDPDTFDDSDYFELEDLMSLALSDDMLALLPKIVDGEVALDTAKVV